jgi:hypothetical protein
MHIVEQDIAERRIAGQAAQGCVVIPRTLSGLWSDDRAGHARRTGAPPDWCTRQPFSSVDGA